jgi:hypothetical protein
MVGNNGTTCWQVSWYYPTLLSGVTALAGAAEIKDWFGGRMRLLAFGIPRPPDHTQTGVQVMTFGSMARNGLMKLRRTEREAAPWSLHHQDYIP